MEAVSWVGRCVCGRSLWFRSLQDGSQVAKGKTRECQAATRQWVARSYKLDNMAAICTPPSPGLQLCVMHRTWDAIPIAPRISTMTIFSAVAHSLNGLGKKADALSYSSTGTMGRQAATIVGRTLVGCLGLWVVCCAWQHCVLCKSGWRHSERLASGDSGYARVPVGLHTKVALQFVRRLTLRSLVGYGQRSAL